MIAVGDEMKCDRLLGLEEGFHHQDPFDRLIIAQAKAEDYILITNDNRFKMYDVKLA